MDGCMDRGDSGSTSRWHNTVDGVDKDDGVGVNEQLVTEMRERGSLVAISDNDATASVRGPTASSLASEFWTAHEYI
jgi:hypothetical protein